MRSLYGTIVTVNYVARALCLYESFRPFAGDNVFAFYCIDDQSAELLKRLHLSGAQIWDHDAFVPPEVRPERQTRLLREYCWTCKPVMLKHALATTPEIDWAVYLDADMFVFGNPNNLRGVADSAVGVLTPIYYSPNMIHWAEPTGRHGAGYAAFRNRETSQERLAWWLDCCIKRPGFDERAGETFDQKILDEMRQVFSDVVDSPSKGLNAGPWGIDGVSINMRSGQFYLDDDPLVIYHFHGLRVYSLHVVDLYAGPYRLHRDVVKQIYRPYLRALQRAYECIRAVEPGYKGGFARFTPQAIKRHALGIVHGWNNLVVV